MKLLQIERIEVDDRQRSAIDPNKLAELEMSIEQHGLLHPIIVTYALCEDEGCPQHGTPHVCNGEMKLIAGGRRLEAISRIHSRLGQIWHGAEPVPHGFIPVTIVDARDTLKLKEIELDENLIRENLSWQDETKALAEIHALRKLNNPEQTYTETGKEIIAKTGSNANPVALSAKISRAMITSQFLDDPDVKGAANEKLAFNAAARKIRNEFAAGLKEIEAENASPHSIIEGNAVDALPTLEPGYRCFILDPPYGVGADSFGNAAQGRHSYDDSFESALLLNGMLIHQITPLASSDAHLWLFCDIDMFTMLKEMLDLAGWKVFRTPLVWNSGTSGHVPNQKVGIRRNYELILFAYRDTDRGLAQILDDVIKINQKSGAGEAHGAAKPTELYELLLRMSALPGDRVLDPTCGSGTIFRAAHEIGCVATGIEMNGELAENCRGLIAELGEEK